MCSSGELGPQARSMWKYVNTSKASKDKYLIELPANVRVPEEFHFITKRGSGSKQINKYRTTVTAQLVKELEDCYDILDERKAKGMQLIFAKFDSYRNLWKIVANATAMLDALGSLAITSAKSGYSRPTILDCSPDTGAPSVSVSQGRHPCIESSLNSDFIPNDLCMGTEARPSRVLLLSGPNMGGKSTILRQTCMIAILAQIGCFVPAESCEMTPIDRIFTRLGASDRILMGQSTFFVELAEMAAALRGATKRSLVIMDELGRGTSTFDGQAIASATIKHLIERSQCLALFATHYHALLEEWNEHPMVRLGHMECMVEDEDGEEDAHRVTFLYTLGDGVSPKSFGINVARLAGLPEPVLAKAKQISSEFEAQVSSGGFCPGISSNSQSIRQKIKSAIDSGDWSTVKEIQANLRSYRHSQEN
jgi:DNA mismatch repair protein MSH6